MTIIVVHCNHVCLFTQVKLKMKSATVQRNIASPAAFKEFLKSDDSLLSWNVSECETYCLANVMGVPIHQVGGLGLKLKPFYFHPPAHLQPGGGRWQA